ncbi:MAG: DNA primase [Bdellovibrionaceae bacterium]|nr:DNA primase [Pseudobdellovibrionaceae bacterium]
MKFSQEFIEQVQDANNLVDIISQYTQLKQSGSGLMGRCPFPDHKEKTPSFSVSEAKQVYHCFGCQKSGNIFTFLNQYQGMSFPQSMEYLADRAGITLPKDTQDFDDKNALKKKEILKLNKAALSFFNLNLERSLKDSLVRQYIIKRGLSEETIKLFRLGWTLPEWETLASHLRSSGYSLDLAEEARLVKRKTKESGFYDIFRERLIFPITNSMGDVLAFGGRILAQGEPKYLNSPETQVFQKGKIFYGLEQTARYIRSEDQIIIVEGYMDLISLFQSGIRNVVATMGTALTSDHGRVIKRLTRNVVVLFDGDRAGREAAERSLSLLLEQDLYPRGLILPDSMDPDDFVKSKGVEELNRLIDRSPDLMNLIFMEWLIGFGGEPSEKIKIANKLKRVLDVIPDFQYRKLYVEQLAPLMGVEKNWLRDTVLSKAASLSVSSVSSSQSPLQSLSQVTKKNGSTPAPVSNSVPKILNSEAVYQVKSASKVEKHLLSLIIKSRANFEYFFAQNLGQFLVNPHMKKLFNFIDQAYRQSPEKFDRLTSLLITQIDDPSVLFYRTPLENQQVKRASQAKQSEVSEADSGWESVDANDTAVIGGSGEVEPSNSDDQRSLELETKFFNDVVKRVKEDFFKERLKTISHELKVGATPEKLEEMREIQKSLKDLKDSKESAEKI